MNEKDKAKIEQQAFEMAEYEHQLIVGLQFVPKDGKQYAEIQTVESEGVEPYIHDKFIPKRNADIMCHLVKLNSARISKTLPYDVKADLNNKSPLNMSNLEHFVWGMYQEIHIGNMPEGLVKLKEAIVVQKETPEERQESVQAEVNRRIRVQKEDTRKNIQDGIFKGWTKWDIFKYKLFQKRRTRYWQKTHNNLCDLSKMEDKYVAKIQFVL